MKSLLPAMLALVLTAAACADKGSGASRVHDELKSVYYWKTVFRPDSAEREFVRTHDIGRIYLRMFDVSVNSESSSADDKVVPNATVGIDYESYRYIADSLQHVEFVPVVYVTLDALKAMSGEEGELAENIVTRVRNMVSYNALPGVAELQLDCDWTASTEKSFFTLCDSVRSRLKSKDLPWRLSSTIRLHQLSRKVPPVDNGVLMVYNTGSFDDPDARNSILDADDVAPYLKHLSSYPLHLDVAYPAYSWQLLFHKRRFIGLVSGLDLTDTKRFAGRAPDVYEALVDIPYGNVVIHAGDMVREEVSTPADIMRVRNMIESRLAGREHSGIIYHLDSDHLSKFSSDEIENILTSGL